MPGCGMSAATLHQHKMLQCDNVYICIWLNYYETFCSHVFFSFSHSAYHWIKTQFKDYTKFKSTIVQAHGTNAIAAVKTQKKRTRECCADTEQAKTDMSFTVVY